jgi:hypothetical protein
LGSWEQEPQSLMPTATPTEADVLFFAGFYEGEGSATRTANGGIVVQVPQKDPEVIYRGRSLWGGSIRRPKGRDISVWVLCGDRARLFLIAVYPHVSSRRKSQIESAGGLILSGRGSAKIGGISAERKLARSSMTEIEKRRETNRVSAANRRMQKAANAHDVLQVGGEISERKPLLQ